MDPLSVCCRIYFTLFHKCRWLSLPNSVAVSAQVGRHTEEVNDGVVVAGEQTNQVFEQQQKTRIDDGVRQLRLCHLSLHNKTFPANDQSATSQPVSGQLVSQSVKLIYKVYQSNPIKLINESIN